MINIFFFIFSDSYPYNKFFPTMENFLEEFIGNPGLIFIGEKIFQYLDVKELNKCRSVKRSWKNFIENQIFFYKLLIAKVGEKLNLSHFTFNLCKSLLFIIKFLL